MTDMIEYKADSGPQTTKQKKIRNRKGIYLDYVNNGQFFPLLKPNRIFKIVIEWFVTQNINYYFFILAPGK